MTQHIRETVVEGIITALERIVDDTSQAWASNRAPRVMKTNRAALNCQEFPFIIVTPQGETKTTRATAGATRIQDSTMTLLLQAWVDDDIDGEKLSAFIHDIEKAAALDPSFGDTCRDSRITGNQTTIESELGGRMGALVTLEVEYGHLDTDPSTER